MEGKLQQQCFDCLIKVQSIKRRKPKSFYNEKMYYVQSFEAKCFVSTINDIGQNGDVYAIRINCLTQNELTYNTLTSPQKTQANKTQYAEAN